ncbi:MAG: ABC-F family ATP-binding cassette domain-containing protein [Desulfomonile tiedjei]|nr:ABC-F family ATP-binding cassette domain-containing protein [Desulfomonile tiedjei]
MIFLSNVAKFFNGQPLFEQASISVHRGDRIGMVGPNGAGKSTILGMMEGVITPDEGEVSIEKKIRVGVLHQELIQGNDGPILQEVINVSEELREIRARLKKTEKEMEHLSETADNVDSLVEEHGRLQLDFERYNGYSLEARALKVLQGLGFKPGDEARRWSEFSGGWRMRVALAKILLAEPDALLLDEPTNHLDLESLLWVEDYLAGFKGAMVIVSHDRAFLNRLVNRIVEVNRGKVTVYSGDYDTFERTRQMQDDIILAAYKNQQEKRKHIQKFIDRNRVKARTASRVQSRLKMLEKLETVEPPSRAKTIKFNFPQPPACGRRVLELGNIVKRYGELTVYDDFSLNVEREDRLGLVGPNGAGKSTLLKIVAGVTPIDDGTIKYGHLVKAGYFAQHQSETFSSDFTVLEEAVSVTRGLQEQEVRNLLGAFLFSGDDVFKRVKVLSGGEKSRLALVKILLAPPNLLVMDEPTNHLDISSCEMLEEALKKYTGTLVLITHDRRLMNSVCTGILEITGGTAEYYPGNYDDYQFKKKLMETQAEEEPAPQPVAPVQDDDADAAGRESRKDRKRREAQLRIALSRKQAPIRDEVQGIEKKLAAKEARRKEIESILADPTNYEKKDRIMPLLEETPVLEQEIKRLETRWEELQLQLEQIETSVLNG